MLKRTITGVVMTAVAIPICIFSSTWVFPVFMALLSVIGCYEMLKCESLLKNKYLSVPLLILSGVFPLLARYIDDRNAFLALYSASMVILLIFFLFVPVFTSENTDIAEASTGFVTCIYVTTAFVSLVLLRDEPNGQYYFLVPIIGPCICDIFAYITGRLFGKHKLCPVISPKKTVEGSVGGTLFCIGFCFAYGLFMRNVYDLTTLIPAWMFAVAGLIIAVVSQFGDLAASAIKRKYGVKDYGRIFPGHGGVMDRFDSMMPTAPLFMLIVIIVQMVK